MSKEAKLVRNQVRNVAKELLPSIIKEELFLALKADLTKILEARLDAITNHLKTTLAGIEQRTKEVQSYIIRNSK